MAKQGVSRLAEAILETVDGLYGVGVMDDETHARITMRHRGNSAGGGADISEKAAAVVQGKDND